jgi:hypothetical protein
VLDDVKIVIGNHVRIRQRPCVEIVTESYAKVVTESDNEARRR